jgi:hypothetical protein
MKSLKGDFGSKNSQSTLRLNGVFGAIEEKESLRLEANGDLDLVMLGRTVNDQRNGVLVV